VSDKLHLYQIMHEGDPEYVLAPSHAQAVALWQSYRDDDDEPENTISLARNYDVLVYEEGADDA
jgi:hypothetical protein